jgi:hypothetical protein
MLQMITEMEAGDQGDEEREIGGPRIVFVVESTLIPVGQIGPEIEELKCAQ